MCSSDFDSNLLCDVIDYRNEIQALLKTNPLFVYESTYVESVELFYKICRGALSGPYQNFEFIYPGRSSNNYECLNYYSIL